MALANSVLRDAVRSACIHPRPAVVVGEREDLSPLERTVVSIGATDARRGLWTVQLFAPSSRLYRLTNLLLGRRTPATLADPRLEALRRFAHVAAKGRERLHDIRSVRDAGFNPAQIVLATRLSREAFA